MTSSLNTIGGVNSISVKPGNTPEEGIAFRPVISYLGIMLAFLGSKSINLKLPGMDPVRSSPSKKILVSPALGNPPTKCERMGLSTMPWGVEASSETTCAVVGVVLQPTRVVSGQARRSKKTVEPSSTNPLMVSCGSKTVLGIVVMNCRSCGPSVLSLNLLMIDSLTFSLMSRA